MARAAMSACHIAAKAVCQTSREILTPTYLVTELILIAPSADSLRRSWS
jgi:hypothetical protein